MESLVVTCIDVCLITFLQYFALLAVPTFHVGLSVPCSVPRDTTFKALRQWIGLPKNCGTTSRVTTGFADEFLS